MPESVNRRGSSGPTIGATERSSVSLSSMAMPGGYPSGTGAQRRFGPRGSRRAAYAVATMTQREHLRALPPVDALAEQVEAPRALALAAAQAVLAERRAELLAGAAGEIDLAARARAWLADAERPSLRRVLNATGVIVHTNLG